MKRKKILLIIFLLGFVLINIMGVPRVGANSLWDEENGNLYRDKTAHRVGDLLTIIILEETKASQKASKDSQQEMGIEAGPGLGIFDFIKAFSAEYGDESQASGSTARQGSLIARVTVRITEEISPGVFKVQGEKSIKVNGEEEKIILTGLVREDDISAENTVNSVHLAQVEIDYTGKGSIDHKQRTSLLEWLLGWLF